MPPTRVPDMDLLSTAVGGVVVGVIGAVALAYQRIKTTRAATDRLDTRARADLSRRDRKDERDGLWEIIEKTKEDHEECRRSYRALQAELVEAKIRATRAETRIQALEEALTNARIPFRPYHPDGGSGVFRVPPPAEEGDQP